MLRILKKIVFLLWALSILSCTKQNPIEPEDDTVFIRIEPTIIDAGTGDVTKANTRAAITDTKFPGGSRIGLCIVAPNAAPAISPLYEHFFGSTNGATFNYYLGNVNNGDVISGFSSWKDITVYGYYPYNNMITNLSAIPFRIAEMIDVDVAEGTETTVETDHMIARPRKRDLQTMQTKGLPLQFDHIMTAIVLSVGRDANPTPILSLSKATFEITEGNRDFSIAGVYKAVNPDTINLNSNINVVSEKAKKLIITYQPPTNNDGKINSSNPYRTILLAMMPELRQVKVDFSDDATIKITLEFRDQDGEHFMFDDFENHGGNPYVTFKLSEITNSGEDSKGLLAGWSYRIRATLGYYNKFLPPDSGVPHVNNDFVDDSNIFSEI